MSAGEISPITALTNYNNGIPISEESHTVLWEISNNVAICGAGAAAINGVVKTVKGVYGLRHFERNSRNKLFQNGSRKIVASQIMANNPRGPVRFREYRAYTGLQEMQRNLPRAAKGGAITAQYQETGNIIQEALSNNTGKGYAKAFRNAQLARNAADLAAYRQKVATQNATGSVTRMLKNKTGLTRLSTSSKELAAESIQYSKFVKGVKGNGIVAALMGVQGLITDIIPAFRVSTNAGIKQTGKTGAKIGVDVAAYAAGSWAGSQIGAGIGAAIGSVVPVAGTAIGGAIGWGLGLIGGCVLSYFADQKMEEIIGENEGDKELKERAEAEAKKAEQEQKNLELQFNRAVRKISDNFFEVNGDYNKLSNDDMTIITQVFGINVEDDSMEGIAEFEDKLHYFIYANNPERYSEWLINNVSDEANANELLENFKFRLQQEEAAKKRSEQIQARVEQSNEHYQGSTNYMDDRTKTERNPFNLNQPGQQLSLMA